MQLSGASVLFGPMSLAESPLKELGKTPDYLPWSRMGQIRGKMYFPFFLFFLLIFIGV